MPTVGQRTSGVCLRFKVLYRVRKVPLRENLMHKEMPKFGECEARKEGEANWIKLVDQVME